MSSFISSSSFESDVAAKLEFDLLVKFWVELRNDDSLDSTIWRVLEPLERRVTDCLFHERPPDIGAARRLTIRAIEILNCNSSQTT